MKLVDGFPTKSTFSSGVEFRLPMPAALLLAAPMKLQFTFSSPALRLPNDNRNLHPSKLISPKGLVGNVMYHSLMLWSSRNFLILVLFRLM